jgi:hypothetical protein
MALARKSRPFGRRDRLQLPAHVPLLSSRPRGNAAGTTVLDLTDAKQDGTWAATSESDMRPTLRYGAKAKQNLKPECYSANKLAKNRLKRSIQREDLPSTGLV